MSTNSTQPRRQLMANVAVTAKAAQTKSATTLRVWAPTTAVLFAGLLWTHSRSSYIALALGLPLTTSCARLNQWLEGTAGEEEKKEVLEVLESHYLFRYGDKNDPAFNRVYEVTIRK